MKSIGFTCLAVAVYVIGFSLGDELGLAESLGNVEGNRRRSLNTRSGGNVIGAVPASNQLTTSETIRQSRPHALTVRTPSQKIKKSPIEDTFRPAGVPEFKPIDQSNFNRKIMVYPTNSRIDQPQMLNSFGVKKSVPAFQSMPNSVSRISTNDQKISVVMPINRGQEPPRGFEPIKLPSIDLQGHTVEELAAVANVSVSVIRSAIHMKQQEMLAEQKLNLRQQETYNQIQQQFGMQTIGTTTTTTTTTTPRPPPIPQKTPSRYPMAGGNKVMNAPKEYYPVGYEKNFDDNFTSKVDLPGTSFHCGDQKHFPGLYADEDLGCMVFHVCALTDDGLIMKSFLCPESTLFDQTILKCNWWFYTDCKNSRGLYDSNIPVSKSYQLMKALTFFSKYKNTQNEKDGVDVEALKNSVVDNKTV